VRLDSAVGRRSPSAHARSSPQAMGADPRDRARTWGRQAAGGL